MRETRRWIVAATTLLMAAVSISTHAVAANTQTADGLFALFARQPHARTRFVETRYLSILNKPLVSSGILAFDAPGRLEKQTLKPARESFVLDDNELTVERPDQGTRRSFDVEQQPALWAFVEAFRATLAGDLAGLKRFYRVALVNRANGWRLRLTPMSRELRKRVKVILIDGMDARIDRIEIRETNGDRSVMAITSNPNEKTPS